MQNNFLLLKVVIFRHFFTGSFSFYYSHYFRLKSDSQLPKKSFYCINESALKMMKNAFYFVIKALFVLKIITSLSWFFGQVGKTTWLDKVNFKNLWRHSLVIWQNIGNQTIIFDQLIEKNKENIFLQTSYRRWAREKCSRPLFIY